MSIEEKLEEPIKKVRITREAFEKMNNYARLVSEIVGRDVECAGLLLNDYEMYDDVTRDVYLSNGQTISESDGNFNQEEDAKSYAEIKKKRKKVSGIWHSHGSITASHSQDDDRHLRKMYITKSKNNKISVGATKIEPEIRKEGEKTKIVSDSNIVEYERDTITIRTEKGRVIKINIEGKIKQVEEEQLKEKGFVNSIVINKRAYLENLLERGNSYYCECLTGEDITKPKKLENLELETVEEDNGIVKDEKTLISEVGERVIHEGRHLNEHPNYQNVLSKYANVEEKQERGYKKRLREFYRNYKTEDEIDRMIVSLAKIVSGDYKINEKLGIKNRAKKIITYYKPTKAKKQSLYRRMKPNLQIAALCACIGLLGIAYVALTGIEKASIGYLKKTRPEVASMMERGEKFSEIAKVYYSKQDGKP